ncbi:hypothetical protein Airi01_087940 [Actinoallomurus iriomotensis]|uniref:Uncharacterized protein n=1 Tax=Actinoallomurus iriomotensis TaxID=478107 RepID=A0A9W6VVF8_9ACTN|nr:hypothetical protein Airi01_087940 [Actinoallomurus iriomotensis]
MQQGFPHLPVKQRNDAAQPPNEPGGTPGLMTVVNAMLVGVPAAYAGSHSILVTAITAVVTLGVVLMWRWIR